MTTEESKRLAARLRSVVASARGDDLERATAAFRGLSEAQLDEQHGQSERTRRQVWDEYKRHRANDDELAAFTEDLLKGWGL